MRRAPLLLRLLLLLWLEQQPTCALTSPRPSHSPKLSTTINNNNPTTSPDYAFVTFFYDYGVNAQELRLATRVLMHSIAESNPGIERLVVVPLDGCSELSQRAFEADGLTILRSAKVSNVQRMISNSNSNRHSIYHYPDYHETHLAQMKNILSCWTDVVLSRKTRLIVLSLENLVLESLAHVFRDCSSLCLVESTQSVVYANSMIVVTPEELRSRDLLSRAIERFEISGQSSNHLGVDQGFIPGLFEALEASPMVTFSQGTTTLVPHDPASTRRRWPPPPVIQRLPFYCTINHMLYYERLNWDLVQCQNPNHEAIPGPVLSFKYSGRFLKPWFWIGYVYFNIFWVWHDTRCRLDALHGHADYYHWIYVAIPQHIISGLGLYVLTLGLLLLLSYSYQQHSSSSSPRLSFRGYDHLPRYHHHLPRKSSNSNQEQGQGGPRHSSAKSLQLSMPPNSSSHAHPIHQTQQTTQTQQMIPPFTLMSTLRNLMPVGTSGVYFLGVYLTAIFGPPVTCPPVLASKLWWFWLTLLTWSWTLLCALVTYHHHHHPTTKKKKKNNNVSLYLREVGHHAFRLWWFTRAQLFALALVQGIFLLSTNPTWYTSPVQKPVMLVLIFASGALVQWHWAVKVLELSRWSVVVSRSRASSHYSQSSRSRTISTTGIPKSKSRYGQQKSLDILSTDNSSNDDTTSNHHHHVTTTTPRY